MDKKEREEYKKKIKRYERLGAVKFQKLVLLVENIKFKVIKKFFPNCVKYVDKYLDWKQKGALKRAKTEEEKKRIRSETKFTKMAIRKELNEEKNRNYHIDPKRPTEIIKYLHWNKEVHKRGLIKNGILIPILVAGTILHIPVAAPFLAYELISAFINFECINIQNYNICRMEQIAPRLKRKQEQREKKNIEEFGSAAEVIHKSIEESQSLPSFNDILENISSVEQLQQMRALFYREQEERQKTKQKSKDEQVPKE